MQTRRLTLALLAAAVFLPHPAAAQTPHTGREMYLAWCASCHADDGSGHGATRTVATPPTDFTNCRTATEEADADWQVVIARGGSAAGLSFDMPAFETLSGDQISQLVAHLRTFCVERGWPNGNLNLPRTLFTAKAFPDTEIAMQPAVSHSPDLKPYAQMETSYSFRVGRRAHVEVSLPAATVNWVTGRVVGIGDLELDGGYVVSTGASKPVIVTAGLKTSFPTGSHQWDFGEGTAVFEPYLALGATWRGLYLQGDIGGRFLKRRIEAEDRIRYFVYDFAVSHDLSPVPSTWNVGVEINGLSADLSFTPEIRKGLTRTGALAAAFGVQIPITAPFRHLSGVVRWTGYIVWDYLDTLRRRHLSVK